MLKLDNKERALASSAGLAMTARDGSLGTPGGDSTGQRTAWQHRPPYLRLANAAGPLLDRAGLVSLADLRVERLEEAARRRAGASDLGPPDYREPLAVLLRAYREEAQLNLVGVQAARTYVLRLLCNRIAMERDRDLHPAIRDQAIVRPVVILGLPRTGSTALHQLLAVNPAFRTPLSWEVMRPSPPPRAATFDVDARIGEVGRQLAWVDRIAPAFKRIHPVGAGLPQECIALTAQAFRSIVFHTTNDVPSYQAWLDRADLAPAYAYHHRFLQHLQAFGPPGRWLLKAPGHLFGLDALLETYPDAVIIQTHRDPLQVLGSIASHCAALRQAFSEHLDLAEIGRTWARLWADGLERTLAERRARPDLAGRIVDVQYTTLLKDPLGLARMIHDVLDMPLGDDVVLEMQRYLEANPQHRNGRHRYRLADFELDAAEQRRRFASYVEAFGIETGDPAR